MLRRNSDFLRFEHIKLESLGDVVRLSINRPERLNAIDWKTRSEIVSALKLVGANSRVRCVILTGVGRRAFSAGEDLGEVKELSPSKVRKWAREWTGFLVHIMTVPQPMVTSSPGYSVGAGWQDDICKAGPGIGHCAQGGAALRTGESDCRSSTKACRQASDRGSVAEGLEPHDPDRQLPKDSG